MKGLVFVEFLEMVEEMFSPDIAQNIVDAADLPSGGAYTSLGTYDHREIVALVSKLSQATGQPASALVRAFGEHLFKRLFALYPQFFDGIDDAQDFLRCVDGYVHMEVRKLYPEAELPSFYFHDATGPGEVTFEYRSGRPFADLAEGMILACIRHFGSAIEMERQDLPGPSGTAANFILRDRQAL